MASEQKWGCGCHEVDGKLEVSCTQIPLQGDLSAERHAVAQPYSAKCFRLAAEAAAASDPAQADPAAANQASPAQPAPPAASPAPGATVVSVAEQPEPAA